MSRAVRWRRCTPEDAPGLHDVCGRTPVVAGDDSDGTPLWVMRAMCNGDMIPGKYRVKHRAALVPYYGKEHKMLSDIEVLCADPSTVTWVRCHDGEVPPTAVQGGWTRSGEALYIGRVRRNGSVTPGKVHPTHGCMYMGYLFEEHKYKSYEVLCTLE